MSSLQHIKENHLIPDGVFSQTHPKLDEIWGMKFGHYLYQYMGSK